MHVAEDLDDLHERPVDLRGSEALLGEHELGEVARGDEVHDEDEELRVLEGVLEVDLGRYREI